MSFFYTDSFASSTSDDFRAICKNILDTNQTGSQIYTYCQSALTSKKAAEASTIAWKIWAAVLGVCAAACVAPLVSGGLPYICPAMSISALAADSALTKNFSNAMMGIFTLGIPLIITSSNKKEPSSEKMTQERKLNTSACAFSANAGLMIFMDYNNTQTALASEKASLQSARSLASTNTASNTATSNLYTANTLPGSSITNTGTMTAPMPAAPILPTSNTFTNAATSGGYCMNPMMLGSRTGSPAYNMGMTGMMQCAFAASPQLPPSVNTPQFDSNFQKVSGVPLGEYLTHPKNQSPAIAVAAATKNLLTPEQSAKFLQDFQNMGQQWQSGGIYSTSKRTPSEKSQDLFSSLIDQLHPKMKEEVATTSEISFHSSESQETPIKIETLFERISRYYESYCKWNQKEITP